MTTPTEGSVVADFIVPGNPVPKQRARVLAGGDSYTPERTRVAENHVAARYLGTEHGVVDGESKFSVTVEFTESNKRHRDIDNMGKLVLDALNKIVWEDDWQIDELVLRRMPMDRKNPRTWVVIARVP